MQDLALDKKNQKQLKKRDLILNGNLLKVIFMISLPILLYNLCNYMYGIFDMMIVQTSGIGDAADIVVLDQIKNMISTIGTSIAAAGGIIIARKFGEGKIEEAKKISNTLFTFTLCIGLITLLFIPIGNPFLRLLGTDATTIDNAMGYYYVQILVLGVTTLNNCFISIEKAKGNTMTLLFLNLGVIFIKISLTLLFVYGPFENVDMTWIAVATLIAQIFMLITGMIILFKPSNILRVRFKDFNLKKIYLLPIITLAIPIFIGRFMFSFGKVYVNSMATQVYGKMCVGALGISNTIAGLLQNMINSFEDGSSTIVSQNYGNNAGVRIRKTFYFTTIILVVLSLIGTLILVLFQNQIANFFAPNDAVYQEMIINIVKYERLDLIFMGLQGGAYAVLYGFGKTRITMTLSLSQIFLLRIPSLLIMMYALHVNYEACGIAMLISNAVIGLVSFIISLLFIIKLPNNSKYSSLDFYVKNTNSI